MNLSASIDLTINDKQLQVALPVIVGFIGYLIYWFTQESPGLKRRLIKKFGPEKGSARLILSTKYLGAITIGILPLLVYLIVFPGTDLKDIGFGFKRETALDSLLISLGISAVLVLILLFNAKKPNILAKHPEIKVREWSLKLLLGNLAAWAVYLLGYELFFRGVLLYPLVDSIGLWPAIAVNVVMYSGVHIPKGADEAILAIPLAVILSLIGVYTGTIWVAYLVHLAMSWTVTMAALKHQPEMKLILRKMA